MAVREIEEQVAAQKKAREQTLTALNELSSVITNLNAVRYLL